MPAFRRGALTASVFLCVPFLPGATRASAPQSDPLSEVVVTATRSPEPLSRLAVPVNVITRADIETAQAGDITDLLVSQPGVEIAHSGGPAQPASLFLRGTDSNHTAVLVDGVRINPGTIGGASLQAILPESIERIEVVRGPRSTLYGSDAIGGVINILTRAGAARGASAYAAIGGYGTRTLAVDGGADLGSGLGVGGSIVQRDSDGFPPRTASPSGGSYRDTVGNLQLRADPTEALTLRASGWRSAGRVHYDNFGSAASQDVSTGSYALSADWQPLATASYRVALDRAEDLLDQVEVSDYAHTRRDTLELQGNWRVAGSQQFSAGALLAREHTAALSFGTLFDVRTDMRQFFVQDQWQSGPHSLLLAWGHAQHQSFGAHDTWNAEYQRQLGAVRIRAAAGTGFHAPDATDRFGFGGNPTLRPESSRALNVGLVWEASAMQRLEVDLFENRIDDLVTYVITDFVTFDGRNANTARARIRGLEAAWRLQHGGLTLRASGTWQDPRDLSDGSLLLRRSRQHFALDAQYRHAMWSIGGALLVTGPRQDAGFPSSVTLPGYAVLAVSGEWRISASWIVQARIDNALDRGYEEIRGYATSRRAMRLATRFRFH
jgi:vitamin B12 transporter